MFLSNYKEMELVPPELDDVSSKIARYEKLSQDLKQRANRSIYTNFGEYAYENCHLCTKNYEYTIYLLPNILFDYAMFLCGFFMSTISTKRNMLFIGFGFAFLVGMFDGFSIYLMALDSDISYIDVLVPGPWKLCSRTEKLFFVRSIVFLACQSFGALVRIHQKANKSLVSLRNSVRIAKQLSDQLFVTKLSRTIILQDPVMRKSFLDSVSSHSSSLSTQFHKVANVEDFKF